MATVRYWIDREVGGCVARTPAGVVLLRNNGRGIHTDLRAVTERRLRERIEQFFGGWAVEEPPPAPTKPQEATDGDD